MKSIPTAILLCLCASIALEAQILRPADIVAGGILNSRAIDLPLPEYPESIRATRVGAIVTVEVVIDETGKVVSAAAFPDDTRERRNADGTKSEPVPIDLAFRDAAEAAARQAKFAPIMLDGKAVRVRGRILYNFIADDSDQLPRVGSIDGPRLNANAISLPQPAYPVEARSTGVSGSVTVRVVIDQDGNVVSAAIAHGHPLLRAAALEAATKAKFRPVPPDSKVVTMSGLLEYNFQIVSHSPIKPERPGS